MQQPNRQKPENPWINLIANVVAPSVIMSKLSDPTHLGPRGALLVALSLPLGYWIYDYVKRGKNNILSIIGLISILLSGGLGLLELDGFWFAVKEGAVPLLIGAFVFASAFSKKSLVRMIFFNDTLLKTDVIEQKLASDEEKSKLAALEKEVTLIVSVSFLVSAVLNFYLALVILKSPAGTPEFTQELGRMTALSYPVIVVPSMIVMAAALWWFIRGIKRLTGLQSSDIFQS